MALVVENEETTGKKNGNTNGSIIINNNNNNNYNNGNSLNNNLNNASNNSNDRNFRYCYYQKVGFSGVDEKKSLELILKENPIDKTRLIQFVTRFTPLSVLREKVWLLLLNVINSLKQNHILNEQLRLALHLERASIILLHGPTDKEKKLVLMYLLDLGKLDINSAPQSLESEETRPLLNIASVITRTDPQFKYEYTIFREIVKLIASTNVDEIVLQISNDLANASNASNGHHNHQNSQFTDSTQSTDANQQLSLPLKQMLESCFANYIPQTCVIKVWDRLFTGNMSKFMKMMALELIYAHQEEINSSQNISQVLKELSPHKSEKALLKVCQIES